MESLSVDPIVASVACIGLSVSESTRLAGPVHDVSSYEVDVAVHPQLGRCPFEFIDRMRSVHFSYIVAKCPTTLTHN